MEETSPDIVSKYQKLATEYSKLRAQATVLKKAVSEEQSKNHDLKEVLKERDQSIRKLEQEVECLNFRNLQLSKRVSVLQNDLESAEERFKKSKSKSAATTNPVPTSTENHTVLNAELLSRIEENERLYQQICESEVEHKKYVSELSMKTESLQSQLNEQNATLNDTISRHEATINKLSKERAKMELSLRNAEKEVKDLKSSEDICKQELEFVKKDLGTKLEEARRILKEKVFFNDTKTKSLNCLSVPVLLHSKHVQLRNLILELKSIISDMTRKLSDLLSYAEQKIRSLENFSTSEPVNKFASYLHDNTQYLKDVQNTVDQFASQLQKDPSAWFDISSLKAISEALSKFICYLDKLLPYIILSIRTEDIAKGTTPRLKEVYKNLQIISKSLVLGFRRLERYIQLLVIVSCPITSTSYNISRPMLIKKIVSSLCALRLQFDEARKVFGAKVFSDHQLPTVTEADKTTDNCILSCMITVSSGMKKITVLLEEKVNILDCGVPYQPKGIHRDEKLSISPCVPELRERGLKYISMLREEEPETIPIELALKNSKTLSSYADSRESLAQQLQTCQTKLSKLELEKEHWMVECQLLKTKQSRMSPASTENSDSSPEDDETFQKFVKASVNQLVTQIQFADSKALAFQTECENLYQKLKLTEQKKATLEKDMSESSVTIKSLKEEQQTLMKNYEDQLSTMSEHLATMNETLTVQKDEIDALRLAGSTKNSKKGKNK